jgi:urea transport system permease protein
MPHRLLKLFAVAMLFASCGAQALTADAAKSMALGEADARIEALRSAVSAPDEKIIAFIQALSDDAVKVVAGKPVIVIDDKAVDPVTGAESALPNNAEDVMNNNRMRGELDSALAALKLLSPDVAVRRDAVKTLQLLRRYQTSKSAWACCVLLRSWAALTKPSG